MLAAFHCFRVRFFLGRTVEQPFLIAFFNYSALFKLAVKDNHITDTALTAVVVVVVGKLSLCTLAA